MAHTSEAQHQYNSLKHGIDLLREEEKALQERVAALRQEVADLTELRDAMQTDMYNY
jgi:FtsZ-binding cell division protein ZapB